MEDPILTAQAQAAGQHVSVIGAEIPDLNTFAAAIDQWHAAKIEEGNRMLELGVNNDAAFDIEDADKPGEKRSIELTGDVGIAFRVGLQTALHLFKELPFGVSIEEQAADGAQ